MKLIVFSVGKDRSGLFAPGVQEYAKRLSHVAKLELIELPESKHGGTKGRDDEAAAIVAKLKPSDVLVALEEKGKSFGSVQLASWLGQHHEQNRTVAFVIGGDDGLGDAVRTRAQLTLSLSAMTFPHRLARLMLMEQLYRAFTIMRNEPYHRG